MFWQPQETLVPPAAFPVEDITYQSWSASAISQINNLYGERIKYWSTSEDGNKQAEPGPWGQSWEKAWVYSSGARLVFALTPRGPHSLSSPMECRL